MTTSIGEFLKGRHGMAVGAALVALGVSSFSAPAEALPGSFAQPTAVEAKATPAKPKAAKPAAQAVQAKAPKLTVSQKAVGLLQMSDDFTQPSIDYGKVSMIAGTSPLAGFDRHLLDRGAGEQFADAASPGKRLMVSYEMLANVIVARDAAVQKLGMCADALEGAGMATDAMGEAVRKGKGWNRQKVNAIKVAAASVLNFDMELPSVKERYDFNNDDDRRDLENIAFKPGAKPAEPDKPAFALGHLQLDGSLTKMPDVETATHMVEADLDRAMGELNATANVARECADAAKEVVRNAYAVATTTSTDRKTIMNMLGAFESSLERFGVFEDPSQQAGPGEEIREMEVSAPGMR